MPKLSVTVLLSRQDETQTLLQVASAALMSEFIFPRPQLPGLTFDDSPTLNDGMKTNMKAGENSTEPAEYF